MCFSAIQWFTFAFIYLLLQLATPTFQYNDHLAFDILIAKWKIYILKTHIQSFFYGIQPLVGCCQMSLTGIKLNELGGLWGTKPHVHG